MRWSSSAAPYRRLRRPERLDTLASSAAAAAKAQRGLPVALII
jgi:hypothetical protein